MGKIDLIKQTGAEDPHLHRCVQTLQKIDIEIKKRETQNIITVQGTNLNGPLTFTIDD